MIRSLQNVSLSAFEASEFCMAVGISGKDVLRELRHRDLENRLILEILSRRQCLLLPILYLKRSGRKRVSGVLECLTDDLK